MSEGFHRKPFFVTGNEMRVALIGGTGFVGGYLVDALLEAGHDVSLLVRPGSDSKIDNAADCRVIHGDLGDASAIRETLAGNDAVIYNVGILREYPRRGITFENSQYQGVVNTIESARDAGVGRMLLMSANGVKQPGTRYQETKYRAEEAALESGLDVTIFQPSVIFGDPGGKMEFATQLYAEMIRPPLPAVAFHSGWTPSGGAVRMSPVHVSDVAAAFVTSLADSATIGRRYELGGPEVLSWPDMLRRISVAVGKRKVILPMPIAIMRFGATLFDWLPFFPVTRDQLVMLAEGNTADPAALRALIGRDPTPFVPDNLAYLRR